MISWWEQFGVAHLRGADEEVMKYKYKISFGSTMVILTLFMCVGLITLGFFDDEASGSQTFFKVVGVVVSSFLIYAISIIFPRKGV